MTHQQSSEESCETLGCSNDGHLRVIGGFRRARLCDGCALAESGLERSFDALRERRQGAAEAAAARDEIDALSYQQAASSIPHTPWSRSRNSCGCIGLDCLEHGPWLASALPPVVLERMRQVEGLLVDDIAAVARALGVPETETHLADLRAIAEQFCAPSPKAAEALEAYGIMYRQSLAGQRQEIARQVEALSKAIEADFRKSVPWLAWVPFGLLEWLADVAVTVDQAWRCLVREVRDLSPLGIALSVCVPLWLVVLLVAFGAAVWGR